MRKLLTALALLVSVNSANADLLLTGAGVAPGGGTPPFNPAGLTFLLYNGLGTNSALGVTNGKTLTYSAWLKGTYDLTNVTTYQLVNLWSDPASNCEVTGGTAKGLCLAIDNSSGRIQANFNNSTGVTNATDALKFVGATSAGSNGVWHNYIFSMDTVNQVSAFYVDGVSTGITASPLPANEIPDLNNASGFHLGGVMTTAPQQGMFDQAELMLSEASVVCTGVGAPSSMNGINVTCAAANTIPPEILATIISGGKPVDMGAGCTKVTPNHSPEVCVNNESGAANGGTGGALAAQHFSTTSYGNVFAAPYGPGGVPAHQATLKWLQAKNNATVTSNGMTTSAGSMPIAVGDFVAILVGISNSSGTTDFALTCPSGGNNTWTKIGPVNDTIQSVNSAVCYTIVQSGDTSGAWRVTWNAGGAVRTHDWTMVDYTNVASVDQTGSKYNGTGAVTTHPTAAGLTTTSGNETVVSFLVDWDAAVNMPWQSSTCGTIRYRLPDIGSPEQQMIADQYAVANSSNPQCNFISNTAVQSSTFTITLVPIDPFSGGTIAKVLFSQNVFIAAGTAGGQAASYLLHGNPIPTIPVASATNNWFDFNGAWGAVYPNSCTGWTFTGNMNLTTGDMIND